ncbi:MAG: hypothetical protein NZ484_01920 [Patescibacteria group bacterium]|nr:hypothetical protein [Patescibacteria group bacterium]MCX7589966.1 hypothetical protein [Patescibacteria group bacterium]MDW8279679.1 hypothetical protein [bacterium]
MDPKIRKLLIAILFLLFILIGGGFVFYAQGFRIDFRNFQILKVGGIYVKTYPEKADIFLNNKLINRGFSLFDNGVLINGLFPKKYLLEIKAKDYKDWKRHIIVSPSLVSEVKYAVLVPTTENQLLKEDIKFFFVFPNENFLIINSQNNINFNSVTLQGNMVKNISSDFENVLTYDLKQKKYWINNIKNNTIININLAIQRLNPKFNFENVIFTKDNSNELILWDKKNIGIFDVSKNKFNILDIKPTSSFSILNLDSLKIWLVWSEFNSENNLSNFYIVQKTFNNQINQFSLPFKNIKLILKNNYLFLLQSDGGFYKYDLISKTSFKIASDVSDFYLSEDGNMVALKQSKSLEIFNFKDKTDYFRFDMSDTKDILKIEWFRDGRHLFIFLKNKIKFMEIEDKEKENIQIVAENLDINEFNAYYNSKLNRLYFIRDGILSYVEFPDI